MTKELLLGLAFVTAFIFTVLFVPVSRLIAEKIGAIDVPKDDRRMHKSPTPRLGGLAIFFGFLVSVLSFCGITREIFGLLLGIVILVTLGIFDDSRGLGAVFKFCIQIIAALVVIYVGDTKILIFTNPNLFSDSSVLVLNQWISVPITLVWILAIINAVNFIDGLDGLAAGVASIAAVSLVFISNIVGQPVIALIAISIAGACFGFLPFNLNSKRKMFMGDTGSTFLGFTLAVLSIQGGFKSYAVISFAAPMLILGLPLFDTIFAILRRVLTGKNPMSADRGHIHHRLVDMGFSQKQTVFILYALSGILGITAVVLAESGAARALILLVCVLIFIIAGSFFAAKASKQNGQGQDAENEKDIDKEIE